MNYYEIKESYERIKKEEGREQAEKYLLKCFFPSRKEFSPNEKTATWHIIHSITGEYGVIDDNVLIREVYCVDVFIIALEILNKLGANKVVYVDTSSDNLKIVHTCLTKGYTIKPITVTIKTQIVTEKIGLLIET